MSKKPSEWFKQGYYDMDTAICLKERGIGMAKSKVSEAIRFFQKCLGETGRMSQS
mgnify:FL=1